MNPDKEAERRKKENEDKIRRMREGDPLQGQADETWFRSYTPIKKDDNAIDMGLSKARRDSDKQEKIVGIWKGEKKRLCPIDCPFLQPKEYSQTKRKEQHYCEKFNKRVRHFGYHPHLIRLEECINESDTNIQTRSE